MTEAQTIGCCAAPYRRRLRRGAAGGPQGWSIIELVVVVVILGIVAVLAIPQLTRAAASDDDAVLARRLKIMRLAIERYRQDHGTYPSQTGDGTNPAGSEAAFVAQLTGFTDAQGHAADTADAVHCLGPYLRDGIPPMPLAPRAGGTEVCVLSGAAGLVLVSESGAGWIYHCDTGQIAANSDVRDATGCAYFEY